MAGATVQVPPFAERLARAGRILLVRIMNPIRIVLACLFILVVLAAAVVLLFPHSRAAAKGYLDSSWDCYHGERIVKLNAIEDPQRLEGYWLLAEELSFEYWSGLRSSPRASYNRAYTRVTMYALSKDYGYDIIGELERIRRNRGRGQIIVRVTH